MAYEAQGISALDPRVATTEKFINENNIPPDKVPDFLMQMGADPKLAGLVFKYRRVQEAAKKQQNQPPTASVDQEVSNQYTQLKQQERMRQGVAGMPAPNLARAPMQGGITGQPMPRMAGGGIVAFEEGGSTIPRNRSLVPYEAPVSRTAAARAAMSRGIGALARFPFKHPFLTGAAAGAAYLLSDDEEPQKVEGATVEEVPDSGLTDEDIRLLAKLDEKKNTQVAGPTKINLPAAPTFKRPDLTPFTEAIAEAKERMPKNREAALAEEMAREEQLGETKVIEARGKELKAQREKSATSPEKKFWLAFAQAGFTASAKGARNLWETLSIGGVEGMKAYEAMKDKEAATLEKIADKELQLTSMSAAIKRGAMERGDKRFDDTRREFQTLQLQHAAQLASIATAENAFGANIYGIKAQLAGTEAQINAANARAADAKRGKDTLVQKYYDDIARAQETTDPRLKAAFLARAKDSKKAIAELEQTESGFLANQARIDAAAARDADIMNRGEVNDGFDGLEGR